MNNKKDNSEGLISNSNAWNALKKHAQDDIQKTHLKDLLQDDARCDAMILERNGIILDFSRQRATTQTIEILLSLADASKLREKINAMFGGEHINRTEDRAVLHVALRALKDQIYQVDGSNVVPEVWRVLDKIQSFSEKIRNGEWKGVTGKKLRKVVAIGIGGSFLGPLFVHTALSTDSSCIEKAKGRELRFLANVDPIDVATSLVDLDPEETLVVVVSKTFTTAETMLNARTVRSWLVSKLGEKAVAKHMVAVSTNLKLVKEFGIDPENAFGFWDWVGGRYSVCSAVGILPLALQYGFDVAKEFLEGANSMDDHFKTAPFSENLPVLLGLLSVWNVSFLGYAAKAILPYCQALAKFAPHIQQVDMESNGKGVAIDGTPLPFEAGEMDFGEPGTNGQHSFYQLIHQGRTIPCDFIGFKESQQPIFIPGEQISNHDELMSNFFAQPDALAYGKSAEDLRNEGVPESLVPHKTFSGNRPSLSLFLPVCSPYTVGQLLALYEHRVAVQGFVWGINSFDQWGVELGKVLATKVRRVLAGKRKLDPESVGEKKDPNQMNLQNEGFNRSTARLMSWYLASDLDSKSSHRNRQGICSMFSSNGISNVDTSARDAMKAGAMLREGGEEHGPLQWLAGNKTAAATAEAPAGIKEQLRMKRQLMEAERRRVAKRGKGGMSEAGGRKIGD
eukprot:CAMPEP_0175041642 /NCGR_PEP_ID=MMETSP0052_2-20121109/2045_1 /TAXON_ID=51329 ORGANISM="Polytomella parva, Strain SAG 63-3" /NCGR_SAMPLE_ID=MMETSP0052_2 /ASSEMBLY_ACC=CAM_ASM_000194 /LENGTH=678 /DNA_ID=CAMNT_0016304213 /DNA_START=251 /DNA_END=2288 /DNA_ORIENTATION=-